jgi:hypothetical protein
MREYLWLFNRRDARITAQIDAMANDLTAIEYVDTRPFLEAQAEDIGHRIDALTIERLNRQEQITWLKAEVARLGVEVADICTAIEAQEAAARVLADRQHVTIAAE